ncbi:MAG: hypothetical protein L3J63_04180 [Geopsychrobacter sp.]|nr:hypothetical protein [Geopsychrobacter sp.]
MQEVRSICVVCQKEQGIPEQDNDSHSLCDDHLRDLYGNETADEVLSMRVARAASGCFVCPVMREKRCDGSCGLGCANCPGLVA